jgi:hypothetical protein
MAPYGATGKMKRISYRAYALSADDILLKERAYNYCVEYGTAIALKLCS